MPSILKLTPRRLQVYDFLVNYKKTHDGIAPSVAEIQEACELSSTSMVRYHLNSLVLLGMIECDYRKGSRMIRIVGARWIPPSTGYFLPSPVLQGARAGSSSSIKS